MKSFTIMLASAALLAVGAGADVPKPANQEPPKGKEDAAKSPRKDSLFKRKGDAAAKKKEADEDKPPEVAPRNLSGPEKKPASKADDLDKELIKDLTKGSEADEEADPLVRASQRMRQVEEQFAKLEVGDGTLELQKKIVADLQELLKKAQQQQNQKKNQQKQRKQQKKQGEQNAGKDQKSGKQDGKQQGDDQKTQDAKADARIGRASKEELSRIKEQRDIWGHLPEAERQLLEQTFREEKLPEFKAALEKYYKKIAEAAAEKEK